MVLKKILIENSVRYVPITQKAKKEKVNQKQ